MKLLKIVTTLIIAMFGIFTLCSCGDKTGDDAKKENKAYSDLFEDVVIVKYGNDVDEDYRTEKITIDKLLSDEGFDFSTFTYPIKYRFELTFTAKKDFTLKSVKFKEFYTIDEDQVKEAKEKNISATKFNLYNYPFPIENGRCDRIYGRYGCYNQYQIGNQLSGNSEFSLWSNNKKNAYKDTYLLEKEGFETELDVRTVYPTVEYNHTIKKGEYLFIGIELTGFAIYGDVTDLSKNYQFKDTRFAYIDVKNIKYSNFDFIV